MRKRRSDWWFRIHSLPRSKRYADSEKDWKILLSRHRSVSDAMLDPGADCRVTYAQFAGFPFPKDKLPKLQWQMLGVVHEKDEEPLEAWTALASWEFDSFVPWIRARADDELAFIGFHSLKTDSLYMPYDGGADLFSLRPDFLKQIRQKFAKWKSPLKSGL